MDEQPRKRGYKKRGSAESTDRTTITLPEFQLFELRALVGIYAPSLTEVVEWVVGDWLAANQQSMEIRRKRHGEYLASKKITD